MEKKASRKVVPAVNPKRLSKAGKWLRANPNGLGVTINDWRAVMR